MPVYPYNYIEKPGKKKLSREDKNARTCARLVDPKAMEMARLRGYCEYPGCKKRGRMQAAHIKSRGSGGDDKDENLVSLCAAHHAKHHSGQIKSEELAEIVRKRNV